MGGTTPPIGLIAQPGHVLRQDFPRLDPRHGDKRRYGLVLSSNEYNRANDHGVFAVVSSSIPVGAGCYAIRDRTGAGTPRDSVVVPWLYTLIWDAAVEKVGELSQYEFKRALEQLRKVVLICEEET